MIRVALSLPEAEVERLAPEAERHGYRLVGSGTARALAEAFSPGSIRGAGEAPELLVAASDPRHLDAALLETCDRAGVRLVVVGDGAGDRIANELGLVEFVEPPLDWRAIAAAGPRAASPVREGRGRVVAIWGPHGAPGRTTLAITIAAELAALGRRVALVDADTHAASVAPALALPDEAPGFAAACRLVAAGALTPAEFDRLAHRVGHRGSDFAVLTGLGRPSRWPELPGDRVRAALDAGCDWVDDLVVDVAASLEADEELVSEFAAPRRNQATLAVLERADAVVTVAAADPIGLARYIRAHAELLEFVGPKPVHVVVNRVRRSVVGLNPAGQLRQTLQRFGGVDDPVFVPDDSTAFDAALLDGTPVTQLAPRSPARQQLRRFASERLVPTTDTAPAPVPPAAEVGAERRRGRRRLALRV